MYKKRKPNGLSLRLSVLKYWAGLQKDLQWNPHALSSHVEKKHHFSTTVYEGTKRVVCYTKWTLLKIFWPQKYYMSNLCDWFSPEILFPWENGEKKRMKVLWASINWDKALLVFLRSGVSKDGISKIKWRHPGMRLQSIEI